MREAFDRNSENENLKDMEELLDRQGISSQEVLPQKDSLQEERNSSEENTTGGRRTSRPPVGIIVMIIALGLILGGGIAFLGSKGYGRNFNLLKFWGIGRETEMTAGEPETNEAEPETNEVEPETNEAKPETAEGSANVTGSVAPAGFNYSELPEYSGAAYVEVNDNCPFLPKRN